LKFVGFFCEYSPKIFRSMFSTLSVGDDLISNSDSWIFIDDMFLRKMYARFFFMNSSISLNRMSPVFPCVKIPFNFSRTILSLRLCLSSSDIISCVAVSAFVISISIDAISFIGTLMFCVWIFPFVISHNWKLPYFRSVSSWKLFGNVGPG